MSQANWGRSWLVRYFFGVNGLAKRIRRELERGERNHCFVGEWELTERWPEQQRRKVNLRRFALKNGFGLRGYENGLGAVFVAAPKKKTRR